jgi:hypothetical protein
MPINEELASLITEIDANLSHLESVTHGLTDAQFNWRPQSGRWSISEGIAHLNLVNGKDLAPIQTAITTAQQNKITGEGPFDYGFLSNKFVKMMEPPITKRYKAPALYVPPSPAPLAATTAEYRRIAAELRKLAQSANGLHLSRVKCELSALPAPLRMLWKMPLGGRLALITTHDRRHLWQAEQVLNDTNFPTD